MNCDPKCTIPQHFELMQQPVEYCSCTEPSKGKRRRSSRKSECVPKANCNGNFTPSGMEPEVTAGPLGGHLSCCTRLAPLGCWDSCKIDENQAASGTDQLKTPYGPYGPWSKVGPSQFKILRQKHIKQVYPLAKRREKRNGLRPKKNTSDEPMGRMRPWPLSGSCRYAGRPYGPCRPTGAYKSRGPFGIWQMSGDREYIGRPESPAQPCWKPYKPGYRPCTPCHKPLFRPCKEKCVAPGECNYACMT